MRLGEVCLSSMSTFHIQGDVWERHAEIEMFICMLFVCSPNSLCYDLSFLVWSGDIGCEEEMTTGTGWGALSSGTPFQNRLTQKDRMKGVFCTRGQSCMSNLKLIWSWSFSSQTNEDFPKYPTCSLNGNRNQCFQLDTWHLSQTWKTENRQQHDANRRKFYMYLILVTFSVWIYH